MTLWRLPASELWRESSDKLERGGASTMEVRKSTGAELIFKSELIPIEGSEGPVGFSLARVTFNLDPLVLDSSKKLHLEVNADCEMTLSIQLKTEDREKFQEDVKLKEGLNLLALSLEDFKLSVRGQTFEKQLKSFSKVCEFGIGVLYSRQGIKEGPFSCLYSLNKVHFSK